MEKDFIIKDLHNLQGSSESCRLYAITTVRTGETELVLDKTISERFKVQELKKVEDLYERLTCGGGRKMFTLEELAHPFNPNP